MESSWSHSSKPVWVRICFPSSTPYPANMAWRQNGG
jgi:hypothetical protein